MNDERLYEEPKEFPSVKELVNKVNILNDSVQFIFGELQKMMVGAAKPCPFCGGGNLNLHTEFVDQKQYFKMACESCKGSGSFYQNQNEAIAMWNMRSKG